MHGAEEQGSRVVLFVARCDPDITQASMATRLGVAVGTVNWHIKRLIAKGYVKVKRAERKKLRYIITPEGIALRAGDIDLVWTCGYGFPTWLGGPVVLDSGPSERMFASYSKIRPPLDTYQRGLCEWNDEREQFERWAERDDDDDRDARRDERPAAPRDRSRAQSRPCRG